LPEGFTSSITFPSVGKDKKGQGKDEKGTRKGREKDKRTKKEQGIYFYFTFV